MKGSYCKCSGRLDRFFSEFLKDTFGTIYIYLLKF